jgi:nitronate monooxygenase
VSAFTDLVGCRVPIQQAPMGSVSTPVLAVAVAEAGGVGTITALGMSAAVLEKVLGDMAAATSGVLAVNFLTDGIDRDAVSAAASRVRVVDFFWTDPDPSLVQLAHDGGALACWQVGSLGEGKAAADAGCDLIAVQGTEAGGHVRGSSPLLPLLGAVLGAVDVPVLAAGGIADRDSFQAVVEAGADGARVGTRFIATDESGAHPLYKQAVVGAGVDSTEITGEFPVCPLCATSPRCRVLRSSIEALHALPDEIVGEGTLGDNTFPLPRGHGLPPGATTTGHIEAMPMYAGESVALIDSVLPVSSVIRSLTVD